MAFRNIEVHHALYGRLRKLDVEAAKRFPRQFFPGLGSLGLILNRKLDQGRYSWCTPLNCRTFANTGGEGVHFSFLITGQMIQESAPVVITNPGAGGESLIVGEDLFDFLCLGANRGYFALEQLSYNRDLTLEVYTNPGWQPTESWHSSVGYSPDNEVRELLSFLAEKLNLRPWSTTERFQALQERWSGLPQYPEQLYG